MLELKDGDVIVNPDIKRFVTEQLLHGQGNGWRTGASEYNVHSPVTWENARDQQEPTSNIIYWVMRMTDLSYILMQRWHDHQTNDSLEKAMADLPPPEWNDPTSLRRLFDSMVNLWYRVAEDRRAPSLLEDKMLAVIAKNKDFGPSIRADYKSLRKTLKEMELKQGDNWGGRATEWVPDLSRQANLWDRVVNRMLQDEIVYVVPRENIISVDRKPVTVKKAAIRNTGIEEKGEARSEEYQGKDIDEMFDRLINALERTTPQQKPPPPQRACHSRRLPPGAGRDRPDTQRFVLKEALTHC